MSAAQASPTPTPRRRRPLLWGLGALLLLLLLAAALLAGGVLWLWHSEAGMSRVLQQVPGLRITGQQGRPNGGAFAVQRLEWQRGGLRVVVHELAWDDTEWRWRPHPGTWIGVRLLAPRASRVQVSNDAQASDAPPQPPESLRLPIELQAPGLRIGSVEIGEQAPIGSFAADLHLGAASGGEHRVEQLAFRREHLVFAGSAALGSSGELPLRVRLAVATAPDASPAWRAELQADGPLQRLQTLGRLDHASGAAAMARATLAPFAPWPLRSLTAETKELDLAALVPAWPQTRLSGHAVLAEPGSAQSGVTELALDIELDNRLAGSWDGNRLPLSGLQLRLQGQPAQPGTLVFERFQARLAGTEAAGSVHGSGRWHEGRLTLQLDLEGLRPQLLDTRLPPMTLAGPVTLRLDGPAAAVAAPAAVPSGWRGELQVDLQGRLSRRGSPALGLQAEGGFELAADGGIKLDLRQARAQAGDDARGGRASAAASADRSADGAWRLRTRGELLRFDPAPWWPAAAVGRGPHRLNGAWQADLTLPADAGADMLAALRGTASAKLDDSRWAGLDWRGEAELQVTAQALQGKANLRAGPNRLQAQGSLAPGTAAVPTGSVELQAPDLSALAPLRGLVPAAADLWPRQGALTLSATLQGRWPALRSQGTLSARGLVSAGANLGRADARWNLSTAGAEAPLSLELAVIDLARGVQRLERLDARLDGHLRAHTLQLRASSPLRPPAWAEASAVGAAPGGSSLLVQGSGGWTPAARSGGTWRGSVSQLQAAPRGAKGAPWLSAAGLQGHVTLGADGGLAQAGLVPGRIDAFGGALNWQEASWQAGVGGAAPRMRLLARLAPLQVAPLLARLQPQFGWQGDLGVAGTIDVRSAGQFDADVVVERSGGDISFTAEGVTRALGLSDLRLGLAAHGGQWQLTQALVGRNVGVVGGLQTLTTSARAAWPDDAAPLSGGLSLIVPQLAVWAPWLPPGWRLGGELRVGASLGGSIGAPEYRGDVAGENLSVRNLFEGIHLQQGVLGIALTGTQATIRRMEFRDGAAEGTLRVSGSASFGEVPRAQLSLAAEKLRLLDRYDRRIGLSGGADMDLQAERVALAGSFTIDEGLVDATQADAPKLGADVVVVNRRPLAGPGPGGAAPAARPPGPPRSPLGQADVDLRIDLGRNLRLRGRGLDTLLRGQLRVTTPGGQLAVNGVVRAEEGSYAAYGQNLAIERGNVIFRGDVANPQLDILALRPDIDVRVGVVVSGSALNPRVRLYSAPDLGEMDTLTWLVLGRAPEGLDRDDTALLQRAALALLAGERGGSNGLLSRIGLDELSLSRRSSDNASDTIVSLGKQISRRLYVGYEHALDTAGGTWQLIYRVAGRLTLRARTGYDDALDAIWTWRWD